MSLLSKLLGQCRHPRGWMGRFLAREMNRSHAPMTNWVLTQAPELHSGRVLDIGCGGGGALRRMAGLWPHVAVYGIDYSSASLRVAAHTIAKTTDQRRIFLGKADASSLPFGDACFDLAIAIESYYFWPDLPQVLGEIRRVLSKPGVLLLAGGLYLGGRSDTRNRKLAAAGDINCQTLPELATIVTETGYGEAEAEENRAKGWFCIRGSKSAGLLPHRHGGKKAFNED